MVLKKVDLKNICCIYIYFKTFCDPILALRFIVWIHLPCKRKRILFWWLSLLTKGLAIWFFKSPLQPRILFPRFVRNWSNGSGVEKCKELTMKRKGSFFYNKIPNSLDTSLLHCVQKNGDDMSRNWMSKRKSQNNIA